MPTAQKSLLASLTVGVALWTALGARPSQAETVCTQTDRLNVRARPTTTSPVTWKLYKNTFVEVLDYNADFTWAYVRTGYGDTAKTGWVAARYLCG